MLTHLLPWQKVPSAQGVAERSQGALIPLHSFAVHDDMSTDGVMEGAIKPSAQNPSLHF
jgi:hypothetical protein